MIKRSEPKSSGQKKETVSSILENVDMIKREEEKRIAERDKKRLERISQSNARLSMLVKKQEEKRNLRRQKTSQWINNFFGKC